MSVKRSGYICETCGSEFSGWSGNVNLFCSMGCRPDRVHARAFVVKVRKLWDAGRSLSEIGARLGVTRNVIAGIRFRHEFPSRGDVPTNFQRGRQ